VRKWRGGKLIEPMPDGIDKETWHSVKHHQPGQVFKSLIRPNVWATSDYQRGVMLWEYDRYLSLRGATSLNQLLVGEWEEIRGSDELGEILRAVEDYRISANGW
jgi:hypothetical protein